MRYSAKRQTCTYRHIAKGISTIIAPVFFIYLVVEKMFILEFEVFGCKTNLFFSLDG